LMQRRSIDRLDRISISVTVVIKEEDDGE
jgi:hypothetical protein